MSRPPRAQDQQMPTAEITARDNPMRPPADSPATGAQAVKVFFSHISPQLILTLVLLVAVARVRMGAWGWLDAAIAFAIWLAFPFIEWCIHVFILHFRPIRLGRFTIDFYLPKTHRRHHADPWNLHWTFVPRHVHAWAIVGMGLGWWLLEDWRAPLLTCYLSFLVQALNYEWVHYLAHIKWRPNFAYYEQKVVAHRYHHFRSERLWWGVSRTFGDRLFGTSPDPKTVARSETRIDLGIKP